MCSMGFHNCPACGEEYKCDQNNSECPVKNGYDAACEKCEYWQNELEREDYEKELERKEWEREFYKDE